MMESERLPDSLDEDMLRRRLVKRIALAGVAIAALLGGLALIDSMYVAPSPSSPKIPAPPVIADAAKPAPVATMPPEPPQLQAVPTIKASAEPEESSASSTPLLRPSRTPPKPAPPHPSTQGAQTERHFELQMGVFNNVDNAQELLAKLLKNDVPAQLEARVQVGPFKTRAEADEARAKLKAMGLNTGLLMAIHR